MYEEGTWCHDMQGMNSYSNILPSLNHHAAVALPADNKALKVLLCAELFEKVRFYHPPLPLFQWNAQPCVSLYARYMTLCW